MNTYRTSFQKRIRVFLRLDPERDWLILLIVSFMVLVGIVLWNVWVFEKVASGGSIGAPVTAPVTTFSQSSLETLRTIFANRSAEEAKYVSGEYIYIDPSGSPKVATSTVGVKAKVR